MPQYPDILTYSCTENTVWSVDAKILKIVKMWKSRLSDIGSLDDIVTRGHYVVARDQTYEGTCVKQYMLIETYDRLVQIIQKGGNLYEMCLDETVRMYFDVDSKREDREMHERDVLYEAISVIKRMLAELQVHVKRKQMRILSACTSSKVSFHIIVPHGLRDACTRREFGRRIRMSGCSYIDPAPYTRNCLFRCPLSSKQGKNNPLIAVNMALERVPFQIEDYMLHARFIDPTDVLSLNSSGNTHLQTVGTCSVEHVIQKLRENGDTSSQFRSFTAGPIPSFYFVTVEKRRCLSGSGHVHTRNNFIVYCGADGSLVYRCFSPKCATQNQIIGFQDNLHTSTPCPTKHTYNEPRCRPFVLHSGGVQIIQSEMGTGKTYQIRELLRSNPNMKVLIVCFRIELGQYMCSYLEECNFTFYRDVTGILSQDRLICQVNSLHRVYNASYDILILDEIESIIEQFNGVCAIRRRTCWLVMEKLIRDTEHVIALDAAICDRSMQVLETIRKDTTLIRNMHQSRKNIKMIETNNRVFFARMIDEITSGNAIAITSTSANLLVSLQESLTRLFPDKNIILIWSQSSETQKRTYMCNLSNVDVFMYSATLQAGVSIDIIHFSKLFVYITSNGPTPQSLHQMLARIRHFHDNEICLTFDKGSTAEGEDEWSYEQMVSHLTSPIDIALDTRFCTDMGAVISGFAKDWSRVYSYTPFFVCTVHNILQNFNGSRLFRKLFLRQAMSKGYSVMTHTDCWDIDEQATSLLRMTRKEMKVQKDELHNRIASADLDHVWDMESLRKDVDEAVADLVKWPDDAEKRLLVDHKECQLKNAERQVDAQLQKAVLAQFYGIRTEAVTTSFLSKFESVSSRDAFMRLCLTLPRDTPSAESVKGRIADVMRCEGSHLTSHGVMYAIEHMSRATHGIKLALCHQLLTDLGFKHIFDTEPAVIEFHQVKRAIESHRCHIASAMQLREAPVADTNKDLMKFCNSVFYRCYKVRIISSKRKHIIKHYGFPAYRFVEVSSQGMPELVPEVSLIQAKLRT